MIKRGETVRVKFYRERKRKREFICEKTGMVELIFQDQIMVRFPGEHKPVQVAAMDVEKVND